MAAGASGTIETASPGRSFISRKLPSAYSAEVPSATPIRLPRRSCGVPIPRSRSPATCRVRALAIEPSTTSSGSRAACETKTNSAASAMSRRPASSSLIAVAPVSTSDVGYPEALALEEPLLLGQPDQPGVLRGGAAQVPARGGPPGTPPARRLSAAMAAARRPQRDEAQRKRNPAELCRTFTRRPRSAAA